MIAAKNRGNFYEKEEEGEERINQPWRIRARNRPPR
jgi:hypothetical protein